MKRFSALLFFAFVTLFVNPARPQTSGTNLVMGAHWDNNSYIQGTVTLSKANLSGPDTVIATRTLSLGWTNVSVALAANAVYNVTLVSSTGVQLVKFPITTAIINPSNLSRAEIDLVCHAANNSLASAQMTVNMTF
jgi:hypothetical protein